MIDQHIQLEQRLVRFLETYQQWGYDSKHELAAAALEMLRTQLFRQQELMASAALYAEVYAEDEELQALTDQATQDWPEA